MKYYFLAIYLFCFTAGFSQTKGFKTSTENTVKTDAAQKTYGLFIGIDNFVKTPQFNLQFCVSDAKALYKAWNDNSANFALLTNENASREKILNEFNRIIVQSKKNDFVIISLSSHGIISYNDFFFLPSDADGDNLFSTCIPASMILNALSTKAKEGVNFLFIIDACHAASMGFDISKYFNENGEGGLTFLFSASPMEFAFENTNLGHGMFTNYLLEGLIENSPADSNKNNRVSLRELFDYAYKNVKEKSNNMQNPIMIGTLDNDFTIFPTNMTGKKKASRVITR